MIIQWGILQSPDSVNYGSMCAEKPDNRHLQTQIIINQFFHQEKNDASCDTGMAKFYFQTNFVPFSVKKGVQYSTLKKTFRIYSYLWQFGFGHPCRPPSPNASWKMHAFNGVWHIWYGANKSEKQNRAVTNGRVKSFFINQRSFIINERIMRKVHTQLIC